jgi:tetratricopeptide (TPR) repeat protein
MGDRQNAAKARNYLGILAREQGDYERAAALYWESLVDFQEVGDRWGCCAALLGLGDVARDQGDAEGVITMCQQALELSRQIGAPVMTGFALHNLALAARAQAQYKRAETLLEEALAVFNGTMDCRAEFLNDLGLVALDQDQYDRAEGAFIESLHIARTVDMRWTIGTTLEGMAEVAVGQRQPECAVRLFGAADTLRTEIGIPVQPVNRLRYERDLAAAKVALGEEQFAKLWEEGGAMTVDEAVTFALHEVSVP